MDLGARRIFLLATGQTCELHAPPRGALGMVLHATNLLVQRWLAEDIARYRREVELAVLPAPCPVDVQPMDFGHARSLIDRALAAGRQFLDERDAASRRRHAA